MTKKSARAIRRYQLSTPALLMLIWKEAAEKWRRLRSDPAYAACVVARADWYRAVYGAVPPLPKREEDEA